MHRISQILLSALGLLLLAACGSSGSDAPAPRSTPSAGSVTVVVDTRAGDDELVQFQLAAVTLEGPGGLQTANLLAAAQMLTVGDPSGEPTGFRLDAVPSADYRALHLMLTPGSGVAVDATGDTLQVSGPVDVRVAIPEGLAHDVRRESWLVIGHDRAPLTVHAAAATATWSPELTARLDGTEVTIDGLSFPVVRNDALLATAVAYGDGVVQIDARPGCDYLDSDGAPFASRAAFVAALRVEDVLTVEGDLRRDGTVEAIRIRRKPTYAQSRLIGRVLSVDEPAQRFVMRVRAVNRLGEGTLLQAPVDVLVGTATARLEEPNGDALPFSAIAVGRLVKVKWSSYSAVANGLDVAQATEVVVPGGDRARNRPQWVAQVASIDVPNDTLTLEPRGSAPLRLNGQSVQQIVVRVGADVGIERQLQGPGGWVAIPLFEVLVGDRAWVRGNVADDGVVDATRVRVRAQ